MKQKFNEVKDFFQTMHYEVNPKKDAEILGKLLSNAQIRKHITQRLICIAIALFLWIYFNGGKIDGWGKIEAEECSRNILK